MAEQYTVYVDDNFQYMDEDARTKPGAWCEFPGVGRVKILRTTKGGGGGPPGCVLDGRLTIACGDGAVRLVELQRAGGKPMPAEEFLRGSPIKAGSRIA